MAQPKSFTKIGQDDENLAQVQKNVDTAVSSLSKNALLAGTLVEGIVLSANTTLVPHKLGRKYKGYIIVKSSAAASYYVPPSATVDETLYCPLIASAGVTVSIWFF